LLSGIQAGDDLAMDELCRRYLPRLEDWAAGRLPLHYRDLRDTGDIVQEVMIKTIRNLDGFQPKNDAALLSYLRQAVRNRILDEIRRSKRRQDEKIPDIESASLPDNVTPLDHVLGHDLNKSYERALQRLKPSDRDLVIARFEFDADYEEVATATGRPNAQAARVAAKRALAKLAQEMARDET